MNKNIVLSICVTIALIVIIGCGYIIEELGIYFDNIAYTRFIFGIGMVTGLMMFWVGQVIGYFSIKMIKWKNKK